MKVGEGVYGEAARDLGGREGEKGSAIYDARVVDQDGGCADLVHQSISMCLLA